MSYGGVPPSMWDNANLKPSPPGVAQPDDKSGASTPRFPQPQSILPNFNSQSASRFPGPVPSLQLYTPSIAYTTSSEAANPFYISTLKPNIIEELWRSGPPRNRQSRNGFQFGLCSHIWTDKGTYASKGYK
ncbi:hypothetical protein yc1106_01270 [Curvularia clavata]|uniref:Uncharacterized protein n=1 Tax=Curvularia clavata TaxID=95742 RepID=A0A9Q8Z147_CURCL|nr:hypothetical protein yc1106_01270 [Curvularia clavata]